MLLFDTKPDVLKNMVLDNDQYLIPRRDGKILVGSSVEHCGFDKNTSIETKEKLVAFATNLFPALKDFPVIIIGQVYVQVQNKVYLILVSIPK